MRSIKVCAGIGDNIWILQKLVNAGEKFIFEIASDKPQRGKQIFDLLPSLVEEAEYSPYFTSLHPMNQDANEYYKKWSDVPEGQICLSANVWLEQGKRIEDYLPDLETSYKLPFVTKEYAKTAKKDMPKGDTKYIGIYTSSYSSARNWGFWDEQNWCQLISLLGEHNSNYKFVLIGADFDTDLNSNLIQMLTALKIPFQTVIGQNLGYVVEVMKRLDYFVAFPSGLPIMSTMLKVPTLMFYPAHLSKMQYAWADPKLIEDHTYHPMLFPDAEDAFSWIRDEYKIFDRLS